MSDPRRVAKLRDQPHMPDLSDGACRGRDDLDWVPDNALATGQDGIWGGTTTQTRKDSTR